MPMDIPDTSTSEIFFAGAVIGAAVVMLFVTILIVATGTMSERSWQDRAVKDGKAEYYLDADNMRQWRWKQ